MRDGVHGIYLWEMDSTAFTNNMWNPQHLHTILYGLLSLYLSDKIWSPQQRIPRDRVHKISSRETEYTAFTNKRSSSWYLFIRDGLHSIYSSEMGSTVFTHERWSLHLLTRYGVDSIDFQDMESKAISLGRWSPQNSWETDYTAFTEKRSSTWHLLIRDGVHSIYSWEKVYTAFTHEKWNPQLLTRYGVHTIDFQEMAYKAFSNDWCSPKH